MKLSDLYLFVGQSLWHYLTQLLASLPLLTLPCSSSPSPEGIQGGRCITSSHSHKYPCVGEIPDK